MIFGVLSLLLMPIYFVSCLLVIPSFILVRFALRDLKKNKGQKGRGMAITGLVFSIISVTIAVTIILAVTLIILLTI